jgi:hypothetical protein
MPPPVIETETRPVPAVARDWRFRLVVAASVFVVVLVHALWLGVASRAITLPSAPVLPRPSVPVVSYLGASERDARNLASDVRQIRSPVLFALPTPVGFSGPLLSDAGGLPPPSMLPDDPPRMRQLEQPFVAAPFGASRRTLTQLTEVPRALPVPRPYDEGNDVARLGLVSNHAFMVYWMDRPDQAPESIPASGSAVWAGRSAWDMVLFVCFDDGGLITQVMVEKPSPYQDVTAAVLRIARGMVFGSPMHGDCGRLVVVYQPAAVARGGVTP